MTDALQENSPRPASAPPRARTSAERVRVADETFDIEWTDDRPAALVVGETSFAGRSSVPLVEIFTAAEQRDRTSQAYVGSAVGGRMRVTAVTHDDDATVRRTRVAQRDSATGIEAHTVISQPWGVSAVRVQTRLFNGGNQPVVVMAVTSLSFGFGRGESDLDTTTLAVADSEWLAENRWREVPLREVIPAVSLGFHEQDGRGHYGLTSHGSWSSGEHLPTGALISHAGHALAWQIEAGAGWHVDISQARDGGVLSLSGPTDLENHFAHRMLPGDGFDAVPVALASSPAGRDGAIAALTAYRRWLRRDADGSSLPVVYNDFMNTLMGQPTTEQLLPLVAARGGRGGRGASASTPGGSPNREVGDWWATVGEWREATTRFTGGLASDNRRDSAPRDARGALAGARGHGRRQPRPRDAARGGVLRPPRRARHGTRRYHLDFRHPAARAHMDEVVDRIVADYGVSYIKVDYNINPGAGTERDATAAGAGLLGHARAFRDWIVALQVRPPGSCCSRTAARAPCEPTIALLEVTHQQSTSDQQDFRLYAPIAASAPMSILPEQCANWAYPDETMTDEETIFTLVTGLSGRLYLSGFLHRLNERQRALVVEAVELHKRLRADLSTAVPFWPLGLPSWDAETVVLGLHTNEGDLLFVWDRHADARSITVPGIAGTVEQIFPAVTHDTASVTVTGLWLHTPEGSAARVLRIRTGEDGSTERAA